MARVRFSSRTPSLCVFDFDFYRKNCLRVYSGLSTHDRSGCQLPGLILGGSGLSTHYRVGSLRPALVLCGSGLSTHYRSGCLCPGVFFHEGDSGFNSYYHPVYLKRSVLLNPRILTPRSTQTYIEDSATPKEEEEEEDVTNVQNDLTREEDVTNIQNE